MQDFVALLKQLLIMEHRVSEKDADALIKKYPDIIT